MSRLADVLAGRMRRLDGVAWPDAPTRLGFATHRAGIIHRDVKPANILVRSGG